MIEESIASTEAIGLKPIQQGKQSRLRIPIPREHGAWAMLIGPTLMGVGVAGWAGLPTPLFFLAALSLFISRRPLGLFLKAYQVRPRDAEVLRENLAWAAVFVGAGAASVAVLLLVFTRWWLLPLGAAATFLLALQLYLERRRLHRTMTSEFLAIAGLVVTGPSSFYVASGSLGAGAFAVWLVSFLYFANSIFYVRFKNRKRSAPVGLSLAHRVSLGGDLVTSTVVVLALVVAASVAGYAPALMPLAFLPHTYKVASNILWTASRVSIKRVGVLEIGHSVVFVVLASLAFHSSPIVAG